MRLTGNTPQDQGTSWRGAAWLLVVGAVVTLAGVVLLGLAADFLVDLLWFSAIGYVRVFWTIVWAKAVIVFAVFVLTTMALWVNGLLAYRLSSSRPATSEAESTQKNTEASAPPHSVFIANLRSWPLIIAGSAGLTRTPYRMPRRRLLGPVAPVHLSSSIRVE